MSVSTISEEEFRRFQENLLEVKENKYQLEEQCSRQHREIEHLKAEISVMQKENQKINKILNKSKNSRDVQSILEESNKLQQKIESQEEEFRLQHETLLGELNAVSAENYDLKKNCNIQLQPNSDHLVAQNKVLQAKLDDMQDKYLLELQELKQKSAGESDEADLSDPSLDVPLSGLQFKQLSDLSLSLDMEKEEKKIVQGKLETLIDKSKDIENELEKLNHKYKKKLESYTKLQGEKEDQYIQLSSQISQLSELKRTEVEKLSDYSNKLKDELQRAVTNVEELRERHARRENELEGKLNAVEAKQLGLSNEEIASFKKNIESLRSSNDLLLRENDDLKFEIKEYKKVQEKAVLEMQNAQESRDQENILLQEAQGLADKRKACLDELAVKYQTEMNGHKEVVQQLKKQLTEQEVKIASLDKEISGLNSEKVTMEKKLEMARKHIEEEKKKEEQRLASEKFLKNCLKELEDLRKDEQENQTKEIQSAMDGYTRQLEEMKSVHSQESKKLEEELVSKEAQRLTLEVEVKKLKSEVQDLLDNKILHEKKGLGMMKDLKRQLHSEKNRSEKLQNKLEQFLAEQGGKTVEELMNQSMNSNKCDDGSSVSSWSASGTGTDILERSSTEDGQSSESDVYELLSRLGTAQQDKWRLEEKVQHLEASNALMADDLLRKTSIIEHYIMDRPDNVAASPSQEKMSLRRVVDFVKDKGDEKESNRKLQRMLEETLTKNMHLQEDLDSLSNEIVRLSKTQAVTLS